MIRYLYYLFFIIANFKSIALNVKQPNIIVFLTDDQDLVLGGMTPLKSTIKNVANYGITFENAFVNAPICCPSRSSILTGRFPHNTKVVNNSVSGNCASDKWRTDVEPFTIAPFLQNNSYKTFYAGKYLNQYGEKATGFQKKVPPGWSSWFGLVGNSKYYNYTLVENGKRVRYKNAYLTDVLKLKAVSFLELNLQSKSPLFMIIAPPAPHAPFTPAKRHKNLFPKEKALRTPAFNCTAHKKHWLLRMPPKHLPNNVTRLNKIQQHRFEALIAVDELVDAVINQLKKYNQLDNTYIIYTSDNGYHIGQFSQPWDKRQPYDNDIRVPLLIRGPNIPSKIVSTLPIQSIDLYPTILQMANVPVPDFVDGESFLNNIQNVANNNSDFVYKNILIEYHGEGKGDSNDGDCPWGKDTTLAECSIDSWCKCQDSLNNTYNCVRSISVKENFLFCRFKDDENYVEAYDLMKDKYQLQNIYEYMKEEEISKYNILLQKLIICRGLDCRNI